MLTSCAQQQSTTGQTLTSNVVVIGCGGIGGWLIPALDKTLPVNTRVILYDKDKIEERNLDRQLFTGRDLGKPKAKQMAQKFHRLTDIFVGNAWFTGSTEIAANTTVFCCADNHRARAYAYQAVNRNLSNRLIVGANEYTDAEAYYYEPGLRGGKCDPTVFYPEILTDASGAPTEHCTGTVLEASPQLAISNMLAASYMMWLYWFYTVELEKPGMSGFPAGECPVKVSGNFSKIRTTVRKEFN